MPVSFQQLLLQSNPVALGVLGILLLCSLIVWMFLFLQTTRLLRRRRTDRTILKHFEAETSLDAFSKKFNTLSDDSALKDMYRLGCKEINSFFTKHPETAYELRSELMEVLERLFEAQIIKAEATMKQGQSFMATVSVTAPFIGLFGTVLGIITTFQSIADLKSVELSVIAPGVAEALLATAAGLFAAIPATLGYNMLRSMISEISENMDYFSLQLLGRFHLQLMPPENKK